MSKETITYWYDATILREGGQTKRQGTVGAKSALEAMDIIVDQAKNRWKKALKQVQLYDIKDGGILSHAMTSTFGEDYALASVNATRKEPEKVQDDDDDYSMYSGFMHSYPSVNKTTDYGFMSSSIGTYKGPESVALWKLTDT